MCIFAAGGGCSDGERDVQLGRERVEESAARGVERAKKRAEAGGDTSSRTRTRRSRGEVSDDDDDDDDANRVGAGATA